MNKDSIYGPLEDSYFFEEFLENYFKNLKNKNLKFLDMGTGSGILAKLAIKNLGIENVTAVDINPIAIENLENERIDAIQSDLFEKIHDSFDIITFNAPYLPEDKREPKSSKIATTGGKLGDEISLEFLKQAKKYLNENGKIFLLISSLTPMNGIKEYNPKIVAIKKIDFEELKILEFSIP